MLIPIETCKRTSWHGNREEIDFLFINAGYRETLIGGRELNCINGSCAVPADSKQENRPCSSDITAILPLLPLDPLKYCAKRSVKEESI